MAHRSCCSEGALLLPVEHVRRGPCHAGGKRGLGWRAPDVSTSDSGWQELQRETPRGASAVLAEPLAKTTSLGKGLSQSPDRNRGACSFEHLNPNPWQPILR